MIKFPVIIIKDPDFFFKSYFKTLNYSLKNSNLNKLINISNEIYIKIEKK